MGPGPVTTNTLTPIAPTSSAPPEADGSPPSLLPDPIDAALSSGDVGAELAALGVQTGAAEQNADRALRDADEARARAEDATAVSALRAEASDMRVQGWVDGALTVGTTLCTKGSIQEAVFKGAQAVADGYFNGLQKDGEANEKAAEGAASDARSASGDAHDASADADNYVKAALSFYQEYVSTVAQTFHAAAQKA